MAADLSLALRVMNHELRAPTAVLQGYLQMLTDGRITDDGRAAVIAKMQRANARIGTIMNQLSDLIRWSAADLEHGAMPLPVGTLVGKVEAGVAAGQSVRCVVAPQCRGESVDVIDDGSPLAGGIVTLAAAVLREHPDVTVAFRPAAFGVGLDVCCYPGLPPGGARDAECVRSRGPLDANRSGLGVSVFVAIAVIEAHDGTTWQEVDGPTIGLTLQGINEP